MLRSSTFASFLWRMEFVTLRGVRRAQGARMRVYVCVRVRECCVCTRARVRAPWRS